VKFNHRQNVMWKYKLRAKDVMNKLIVMSLPCWYFSTHKNTFHTKHRDANSVTASQQPNVK